MDLPRVYLLFLFLNFLILFGKFPASLRVKSAMDLEKERKQVGGGVCVYAGVILDSRILKATAVYLVIVWR